MLNHAALMKRVNKVAVEPEDVEAMEKTMALINLICYSTKSHTEEVDFNSFSLDEGKRAFNELFSYCPDDSGADPDENRGNLLLELNRIAHLRQDVMKLRNPKSKRRFF